jgi:predicted AAA+ superfamily ATPase
LDLERAADLARLDDPESLFAANVDHLICMDEIQRRPELFPALRVWVDRESRPGQFLVLGSASRELLRQSSETLAGRIRYLELTPFVWQEVRESVELRQYWSRGGFPSSCLAIDEAQSFEWRLDFIRDFMERDVPMYAPRIAPQNVERLWKMLAHLHGQLLNMSTLATALGVDSHTIRSYIDLLEGAYMVRRLPPCHANVKKRLVKTPKIYLRDTGILHALLGLEDWNELLGHPVFGYSWESLCIENILARVRRSVQASFYRTADGAEIDLILEKANHRIAIEFKASTAPKVQRGFVSALDSLGLSKGWLIAPVEADYMMRNNVQVCSLESFFRKDDVAPFLRRPID